MISEINHLSRTAGFRRIAAQLLAFNAILGAVIALSLYQKRSPSDPICLVMVLLMAFFNFLVFVQYRYVQGFLDTLNFTIVPDRDIEKQNGSLEPLIARCGQYLANNRISFKRAPDRGLPTIGMGAPLAAFDLGNLGLRLAIHGGPKGAFGKNAIIALGPVSDGRDPVARKLLNGLREELLRFEEKGRPEPGG